jgi:hypothetical protein
LEDDPVSIFRIELVASSETSLHISHSPSHSQHVFTVTEIACVLAIGSIVGEGERTCRCFGYIIVMNNNFEKIIDFKFVIPSIDTHYGTL